MKRTYILLLLLALIVLSACGGSEQAAIVAPEEPVCAVEGCGQAALPDVEYCADHAGECSVCGKRIAEGQTLCDDCLIARLDALEPTESKSDIAAYK